MTRPPKPVRWRWQSYYRLAKPGIIRGNLVLAIAGFLLAAGRQIDFGLLLAMISGTTLVMASGCVFNNCVDRQIDSQMARTKARALATGEIKVRSALIYATILGLSGSVILYFGTNPLTALIGLAGLFAYVVLYGIAKRKSTLGTVVGSLAGATPPVAGYCAVTGRFDMAAGLLFWVLVCWQMPHFYAIAMFRANDYAAANLPVLPLRKGMAITKVYIMLYIAAFLGVVSLLTVFGYTGYTYLIIMVIAGLWWLEQGRRGFFRADSVVWARQMFGHSLIILMLFAGLISLNFILP